MPTARWKRVRELFEQSLTYPRDQRSAFIIEACGDDDVLRSELETLVEHDERSATDFLRPPEPLPIASSAPETAVDFLVGQRVGNYEIKGIIASGGMGTVYEAEQANPKRLVALKAMRTGLKSRYAVRHFEHESKILARLCHPNIAQIFEAGTCATSTSPEELVPYFAMEFVPGARTITHYVDEEQLTISDRLALFAEACDAVHYGHQKGVIHRDLKPGNILVNLAGQVKVIDFGIARSTDSDIAITTLRTNVDQLIGTLQYMSPEQCEADSLNLDIRTDVYSLGVVLYELLCGQPPYDVKGSSIHSAVRVICESEPIRPRQIDRTLKGDPELILLKALEKDRDRRYQSTRDFARDIRNYMNREPIDAAPPSAWTRTTRWIRRHPFASTATACTIMVVVAVIVAVLAIDYMNFRPYRVSVLENGRGARLLSRGGQTLYEWRTVQDGGISCGKLVEAPKEFGGRLLAIVGFSTQYGGRHGGKLCVFDTEGDLDEPVWSRGIKNDDIPDERARFKGEDFSPSSAFLVTDIFHDSPGVEIVVVFTHAYSQRSIRIYDLEGHVLYEVWHDGTVPTVYWMSEPGLLIAAGDTDALPDAARAQLSQSSYKPIVVFGLKPKRGVQLREYINVPASRTATATAWYRYLLPLPACEAKFAFTLRPPQKGRYARERYVDLQLTPPVAGATISLTIGSDGSEVRGGRIVSDTYKDNVDRLPDPRTLTLGELPVSVRETDGGDGARNVSGGDNWRRKGS